MQINLRHTDDLQDLRGMLTGFSIPSLLHLMRLPMWLVRAFTLSESYKTRMGMNF